MLIRPSVRVCLCVPASGCAVSPASGCASMSQRQGVLKTESGRALQHNETTTKRLMQQTTQQSNMTIRTQRQCVLICPSARVCCDPGVRVCACVPASGCASTVSRHAPRRNKTTTKRPMLQITRQLSMTRRAQRQGVLTCPSTRVCC